MMSSTLIGWYRGCADSTRFDTVSPLIGTSSFCARIVSWRDLGWGPAEDNRHGACTSEWNAGFNPEGNNTSLRLMLSWSKQSKSRVTPPPFDIMFQGVLLIKHFSWRRMDYTVKTAWVTRTFSMRGRLLCHVIRHHMSIRGQSRSDGLGTRCLWCVLASTRGTLKDKWYTVRAELSMTRVNKNPHFMNQMQPTKEKEYLTPRLIFAPPKRRFQTEPEKFHTDDVALQWFAFLIGCNLHAEN